MIEIIPSILTNDPEEARELIARCEGLVDRISIDIIDGKYASNKTIDPSVFEKIDTSLLLDFQLMVYEPVNWVERCVRGQADRIIGHVEQMSDEGEFVGKAREESGYICIGVDIET